MLVHPISLGPWVRRLWDRGAAARWASVLALGLGLLFLGRGTADAQARADAEASTNSATDDLPRLLPARSLGALADKPVQGLVLKDANSGRERKLNLPWFRRGTPLTPDFVRRVMEGLLETGRYAELSAEAEATRGGVLLRLNALSRKIVARVSVVGGVLDQALTLEQAGVSAGDELTAPEVPQLAARIW